MEKKEYIKKLSIELLNEGFVRDSKKNWHYNDGKFTFMVEIQDSDYDRNDFYINLSFVIDGYHTKMNYWTRASSKQHDLFRRRIKLFRRGNKETYWQ